MSADLASRVRSLEGRDLVRQTWMEYLYSVDGGDWDALADLFTPDATLTLTGMDGVWAGNDRSTSGREEIIRDFFLATTHEDLRDPAKKMTAWRTGHISSNLMIELAGAEATARSYFFEVVDDDVALKGNYAKRFTRDEDRWRIAELDIRIVWFARLTAKEVGGSELW
jgi:hypothetical protein